VQRYGTALSAETRTVTLASAAATEAFLRQRARGESGG
jgi:hypothetical protein